MSDVHARSATPAQSRTGHDNRLHSLDVFRGIAVLGMILVNAADLGGDAYPWLRHTEWDGLSPADLVFPSFLFILGASLGLSLRADERRAQTYVKILRRTLVLFGLGLVTNFLHLADFSQLRIMGVLQRIALCYALVAFALLLVPRARQYWLAAAVLIAYWAALAWVEVPVHPQASVFASNLPSYIDRFLIGHAHLLHALPYESQLDPEGLLSTLPATINTLAGAFCARWLTEHASDPRASVRLASAGSVVTAVGWLWSAAFPINKTLWTSSFVLVSSGVAAIGLAVCYELVDVRRSSRSRRASAPFAVFGLNAIAAYLMSSLIDIGATRVAVPIGDESTTYVWLREQVLAGLAAPTASLMFALVELLLVWAVMYALYRRAWFLRIG